MCACITLLRMADESAIAYFAIKNNALAGSILPRVLKLFRFGDNATDQGTFKVTNRTVDAIQKQVEGGVHDRVLIDFEHNSVEGSPKYQPPPRVHAGVGLVSCSAQDGLVIKDITWTPDGERFARNYPDISPVVPYDKATMEVVGLTSAGLVPATGVIGLSFFSALSPTPQENDMDLTELKKQIDALQTALNEITAKVDSMGKPADVAAMSAKLSALETGVAAFTTLKADIDASFAKRDKDALLVQAAFAGKVPQLTDDAIVKLSVADLKAHIEKLPVTVPLALRTALLAGKPQQEEGSLLAQFNAISDPVKRGEFYAKHKDKLFSAS